MKYNQYQNLTEGKLEAWHTGGDSRAAEGGSNWNIAEDGYTIATVKVTTTRKITPASRSWSGKMHVSIRSDVEVTLRLLGYRHTYTLQEALGGYCGPRTALRKVMQTLQGDGFWVYARLDLEAEARDNGAHEIEILNAFDARDEFHIWNLYKLARGL